MMGEIRCDCRIGPNTEEATQQTADITGGDGKILGDLPSLSVFGKELRKGSSSGRKSSQKSSQ